MKKLSLLLACFILQSFSLFAQWFDQNSGTDDDFLCVFFTDTLNGWIGSTVGLIYKTTDGGESWNSYTTNSNMDIVSIQFINQDTGWCASSSYYGNGRGEIYRTTNGGISWVEVFDGSPILRSISFVSEEIGWAVGYSGEVLNTSDGGDSWILQYTFENPTKPMKVLFLDENIGFVVGRDGIQVWKTTNRGYFWNDTVFYPVGATLDISFSNDQKGIVVANAYRPLLTENTGETWETFEVGGLGKFYGVEYRYPNIWLLDGIFRRIINSSDDGANWFPQKFLEGIRLSDICFVNDTVGWVVGFNGTILKTVNGGIPVVGNPQIPELHYPENDTSLISIPVYFSWSKLEYSAYQFQLAFDSLFLNIIQDVTLLKSFYDHYDLTLTKYYWRVRSENLNGYSDWSEIRSFKMEDLLDVHNYELLIEYSLEQNFPNPFNPKTIIRYRLAEFSKVQLKVYDVLGNEVATLINEEKPAGSYEVEFSVGQNRILSLSSGVYFYQLKAGSFIQTKKMLMLK